MPERYYLQGRHASHPADLPKHSFLFDANIWISINGPFPDEHVARGRAYSEFFAKITKAGCSVCVPQLVLAEYLNRSVMIQAKADGYLHSDGKIHRQARYADWIKEACDLAHHVAQDCVRVPDAFDEIDLEACFAAAEAGGREFHDVMICRLAQRTGAILVTDDADYAGADLPIVTFNTRLT